MGKTKDFRKNGSATIEIQIYNLGYALNGPAYLSGRLTPEEIAIVEGKG